MNGNGNGNGNGREIKFSLVLCTLGRPREVDRYLESLAAQTYRNVELFLIDQNSDDCMVPVIQRHSAAIPITHLRSPLGLSRGRNVGIKRITGDVMALPDDDCVYPVDLLERLRDWFAAHPDWDGFSGSVPGNRHWSSKAGPITRYRLWWQGVDFTMFFRRRVVDGVGLLDERLGLGSGTSWVAGECADYLLRCLKRDFKIWYDPAVQVEHPGPINNTQMMAKEIMKALGYSMGVGHVLQQHDYPAWYAGYMAARPIAGATLSLLKGEPQRAKLYLNVLRGLTRGYLSREVASNPSTTELTKNTEKTQTV